jgi:hypothetical protein
VRSLLLVMMKRGKCRKSLHLSSMQCIKAEIRSEHWP